MAETGRAAQHAAPEDQALNVLPVLPANAFETDFARDDGHVWLDLAGAATLLDITSMAHLGNYYAEKIRGAAQLALFDTTAKPAHRETAVRHLLLAVDHWKRYASAYTLQYRQPLLYNRVGTVDLYAFVAKTEQDVAIARLWIPGTVPDQQPVRQADQPFRK